MTSDIPAKSAGRLAGLLLLNTTVAILVGLTVANVLKSGTWSNLPQEPTVAHREQEHAPNLIELLVNNVPRSFLEPLGDQQNVNGVIMIAVALGIALRRSSDRPIATFRDLVEVAYDAMLVVLHWLIALVPLGVLCIVASVVGVQGFGPFKAMAAFVITASRKLQII